MKIVELYEGTLFECQMISNLLQNEGMVCQINNEIIGTRGGDMFRPGGGGVKIIVTENDFDQALKVVEAFEKSRKNP